MRFSRRRDAHPARLLVLVGLACTTPLDPDPECAAAMATVRTARGAPEAVSTMLDAPPNAVPATYERWFYGDVVEAFAWGGDLTTCVRETRVELPGERDQG